MDCQAICTGIILGTIILILYIYLHIKKKYAMLEFYKDWRDYLYIRYSKVWHTRDISSPIKILSINHNMIKYEIIDLNMIFEMDKYDFFDYHLKGNHK